MDAKSHRVARYPKLRLRLCDFEIIHSTQKYYCRTGCSPQSSSDQVTLLQPYSCTPLKYEPLTPRTEPTTGTASGVPSSSFALPRTGEGWQKSRVGGGGDVPPYSPPCPLSHRATPQAAPIRALRIFVILRLIHVYVRGTPLQAYRLHTLIGY